MIHSEEDILVYRQRALVCLDELIGESSSRVPDPRKLRALSSDLRSSFEELIAIIRTDWIKLEDLVREVGVAQDRAYIAEQRFKNVDVEALWRSHQRELTELRLRNQQELKELATRNENQTAIIRALSSRPE